MRDEAFGDRLRELQRRGLDALIAHELWWSGGETLLQMLERATDDELAALRKPERPPIENDACVQLTAKVCTDPACVIPRKPGRPMHGPHDFRAGS